MTLITPIILCGGSGSRLWPLSRKSYPKQFAKLLDHETLFQLTAKRMSDGATFDKPVIVTNSDFRFIVTEQLSEMGIDPGAVLIEPEGRNTAPAVLAAALHLMARDPDSIMLVAPSDHQMPDGASFQRAIKRGLPPVDAGQMILFGIEPERPETGYGYLELDGTGDVVPLKGFVEKPDSIRAEQMLASGGFLWNSGIFLFKARDIVAAFEAFAPQLMTPVKAAIDSAEVDLGFLRLDPESWAMAEDISIDYAVMEKSNNLSVVPFGDGWSDLGDWASVWRESDADENGVVLSGSATAIDCKDTLLRSDTEGVEVVGIGVEDMIVVAMDDAVLVASQDGRKMSNRRLRR